MTTRHEQEIADGVAARLIEQYGADMAVKMAEAESEALWNRCADIIDRKSDAYATADRAYAAAAAIAAGVRALR